MEISRDAIKRDAKRAIDQAIPNPILVALVFMLVMWVLELLNYSVTGYSQYIAQVTAQLMQFSSSGAAGITGAAQSFVNATIVPFVPTFDVAAIILSLAIGIMALMLRTGFQIFCLNAANRKPASFGNLLDGFGIFLKLIWLYIVMFAFIFLWTLLLIVPGFIAAYSYRQALFIFLENPELGALECITRSKKMMYGHKAELFVLDLSFIGWNLLTLIPFVTIFVSPYCCITYANYYRALRDMPSYIGSNAPPQQ